MPKEGSTARAAARMMAALSASPPDKACAAAMANPGQTTRWAMNGPRSSRPIVVKAVAR